MNADNDLQAASDSAAIPTASPGAMIRQGRERMNLSLDELAGVTKLSYHTIEALERDDFSSLLEAVYVRGYYRKCAKVLDLSEKALLEAYEARVAPKQVLPPAKLRLASGADLGSTSRLPVTLAIGVAVIAVLVCAVVWIARGGNGQAQTQTVDMAPLAVPAPAGDVPGTAVPAPETGAPAAASTDPVAVPPTAAPDAMVAPSPVDAAPAAAVPAAATAPAAPAAAPVATTSSSAVLSFTATSWVRVDDAAGKTLFNGLAQPGESHVLNGALPFNVFLGNAPAVKVEFGGKVFDTQSFTRDNKTARFTLPAR